MCETMEPETALTVNVLGANIELLPLHFLHC